MDLRWRWLLACALVAGCRGRGASFEERAEQRTAEHEAARLSSSTLRSKALPTSSETPERLPRHLWEDLHWLSPEVVGINGTGPGQDPFIVRWMFSQPFANADACQTLKRGLERGYGVEWQEPPQSFVFVGQFELADIEACAEAFMTGLGGDVLVDGGALVLRWGGEKTTVRLFERPGALVLVVDGERNTTVAAQQLASNDALLSMLAETNTAEPAWSATTRDLTSQTLQVPSLGYSMMTFDGGTGLRFRVLFESEDEAATAAQRAVPALSTFEAAVGVEFAASFEQGGVWVSASLSLKGLLALDASGQQAFQAALERALGG